MRRRNFSGERFNLGHLLNASKSIVPPPCPVVLDWYVPLGFLGFRSLFCIVVVVLCP